MIRKHDVILLLITLTIVVIFWWMRPVPASGEPTPVPLPELWCDDCTWLPLVMQ